MSLLPINGDKLSKAFTAYCSQPYFFPLIGAVLSRKQEGIVFVDSVALPTRWYVEHSFGFAQMFGEPSIPFHQELQKYLFVSKQFSAPKVRLYGTDTPAFIYEGKCLHSERQRFVLDKELFESRSAHRAIDPSISFLEISSANIHTVEKEFGVTTRFWSNSEDFLKYAHAVVALREGMIAAICYAAANVENRLEIDVLTLPPFRGKGVAHATVMEFLQRSLNDGLTPLWDCFTNNAGSVALCRSVGFVPEGQPYPFFTIER